MCVLRTGGRLVWFGREGLPSVDLCKDRTTIGRNSTNDVVIKDIVISSTHCALCREADGSVSIEDLRCAAMW